MSKNCALLIGTKRKEKALSFMAFGLGRKANREPAPIWDDGPLSGPAAGPCGSDLAAGLDLFPPVSVLVQVTDVVFIQAAACLWS